MKFFGSIVLISFVTSLILACSTTSSTKPCEFDGSCDQEIAPPPQKFRVLETATVEVPKSKKAPYKKKLSKQKK